MGERLGVIAVMTLLVIVAIYAMLLIVCCVIAFVTFDIGIFGEALSRLTWQGFRLVVAGSLIGCAVTMTFITTLED